MDRGRRHGGTGGRHDERLDRIGIADHVGKLERVVAGHGRGRANEGFDWNRVEATTVPDGRVAQGRRGNHPDAGDESRLIRVAHRNHHRREPGGAGRKDSGQDAVDRPQSPVEPQLAQVQHPLDGLGRHRARRRERRQSDTEVETRAVFGQRRW